MSWTHNEEKEAAKQQLAQEAMALIEQAEQLETQEEYAKAAYTYQQAAEKLQRSGYAAQFIEELYSRVTTCNNRVKQAKKAPPVVDKQQAESLQQQAFSLMDIAKNLKKERRYADAVEQFLAAANLLTEAGWLPEQLEGIRGEITHLQQLMATGSLVAQVAAPSTTIAPPIAQPSQEHLVTPSDRAQAMKQLEERRKFEEEVQQSAFWAIDEGKKHTANKDYEAAIQAYRYACDQLNNIGWTEQTTMLLQVMQELEQHLNKSGKRSPQSSGAAQPYVPTFQALGGAEPTNAPTPRPSPAAAQAYVPTFQTIGGTTATPAPAPRPSPAAAQPYVPTFQALGEGEAAAMPASGTQLQAITQFEEKRKKEKELIAQSFAVIDEADKYVQKEDWDGAIEKYNRAVDFFNMAGWQSQTANLYSIIAKLREEKAKAIAPAVPAPATGVKAESYQSPGLEASNVALQTQLEAQFAARRESVQDFEARKTRERKTQEKAFTIIQEAQELTDKLKFEEASQRYIEAISLLNAIGWSQQTQQLQTVLGTLQERQRQQEVQQQTIIQQQITAQRELAVMQEQTQIKVTAEQERMRQRQASQQEVDSYKQKVNEVGKKAISLIEEAEQARSSRPPNFPTAIQKYEEAQRLMSSIQWQDQADRLLDVLSTIHQQFDAWKTQQAALAQRRQEEATMRAALDKEIRKRMDEDAHLKEIQQKRLVEYQAKRSKELVTQDQAMNILGDAKKLREQSQFTKAIEKYKQATQMFQSIGWDAQIGYIQKEIQATLEDHQRWQEEQNARRQSEQIEAQKAKEMEERARQEALAVQKLSIDLKGMIKKASLEQERKVMHDKVQHADDYEKYLTKEQIDADKRQKMASLKDQVRRELAEKEAKAREEKERSQLEKDKASQSALKDMIRKAGKKPTK